MTAYLGRQGVQVNVKRVRRLMRKMGLEAVYPKPKLSQRHPEHRVYPYLLRDLPIARPNQVWCTDITHIRLVAGFVYLMVIMDWFSRYVISWEVSISLDPEFCLTALDRALFQATPEIFNSDQGCQFTSLAFTERLRTAGVSISMDGRGRVFDNIFQERLWRSVKFEKVYLNDWYQVGEAQIGFDEYFEFYNHERPHQSLCYQTPEEVYYSELLVSEREFFPGKMGFRKLRKPIFPGKNSPQFGGPNNTLTFGDFCLDNGEHLTFPSFPLLIGASPRQ